MIATGSCGTAGALDARKGEMDTESILFVDEMSDGHTFLNVSTLLELEEAGRQRFAQCQVLPAVLFGEKNECNLKVPHLPHQLGKRILDVNSQLDKPHYVLPRAFRGATSYSLLSTL